MFTKIDLCSMALLKLGEKPIQSWREDSASAQLARTLYDPVVNTLLSIFPWSFAVENISLNKDIDGNFIIPNNVLRVLNCPEIVQGNKIKSSAENLEIEAIIKKDADVFPDYFATLVATKLAVEFCIPLIGDTNVFRMMTELYDNEYSTAKFIDSAISIRSNLKAFSLVNSRF